MPEYGDSNDDKRIPISEVLVNLKAKSKEKRKYSYDVQYPMLNYFGVNRTKNNSH